MADRITLLSTSFPPKGGSGVQRPYYQARFLRELGWEVEVLTTRSPGAAADTSFPDLSASGVQVREIRPGITPFGTGLLAKADRWVRRNYLFPDEFRLWARAATKCVLRDGAGAPRFVMASVGSPSTLEVLRQVAAADTAGHVSTIVDFRDFWALNQREHVPADRTGEHLQARRERMEAEVLRSVDGVVVVSASYKRRLMGAYPWLAEDRILVVENGYSDADFARAEKMATATRNAFFTIRYTGFLLRDHNPDFFFSTLAELKKQAPALYARVRFESYGGNPDTVARLAAAHGVADVCACNAYVDHGRAIELLLSADALYLPFARGEGTIGGKTYEYIRSGRPLIPTLFECDEPREVLSRFDIARCVERNDRQALLDLITQLLDEWSKGTARSRNLPAAIASIERREQTARLSSWLKSLPPRRNAATASIPASMAADAT